MLYKGRVCEIEYVKGYGFPRNGMVHDQWRILIAGLEVNSTVFEVQVIYKPQQQSLNDQCYRPPSLPTCSKGSASPNCRCLEVSVDINHHMSLSCARAVAPGKDVVDMHDVLRYLELCVKMLHIISSSVAIVYHLFEQNLAGQWYLFPYLSQRADVCGSLFSIKRHDGKVGFAGEVILESRRDQLHPCRVDVERRRAFKIVFHEYCVKCSIHPEAPKWSDVSR